MCLRLSVLVMGLEAEPEPNSTPRLPLLTKPYTNSYSYMQSPERSGTVTPPLHTIASVPFRWEELPGKPRLCTELSNPIDMSPKCLELPPRLLIDASICKLPSPTTVLEGPYMGKSKFQSSSFRIIRKDWYGSFRKSCSPESSQLGSILSKKGMVKEKTFLGSWSWPGRKGIKSKREVGGGSYVFPSSSNDGDADVSSLEEEDGGRKAKCTGISRTGSFSSLSHHSRPQFWATIYEGLKQVVPWRSRKLKKDGFM